ncbi:hypothetical protein [Pantoea dispersa]|uniref:hypothetical protein n=1 Tax=Pantoea dispersa TaxID=59814 RepID=UPI0030168B65
MRLFLCLAYCVSGSATRTLAGQRLAPLRGTCGFPATPDGPAGIGHPDRPGLIPASCGNLLA